MTLQDELSTERNRLLERLRVIEHQLYARQRPEWTEYERVSPGKTRRCVGESDENFAFRMFCLGWMAAKGKEAAANQSK